MPNLDEIRERWAKGTPGPWVICPTIYRKGEWRFEPGVERNGEFVPLVEKEGCEYIRDLGLIEANADKIANAPTDIAFLLAEVERLEKDIELMQSVMDEADRLQKGTY